MLLFLTLLCVIMTGVRGASAQTAEPVSVTGMTADARELITQAMAAYRRGEFQTAFKAARAAYLDYFENAEPPLRAVNHDLTVDMEFRFADLRSKLQLRRSPEEIETSVAAVRAGLIEIDAMFDASGARLAPLIAFSTSAVIALREGLEALLVIGIVIGALRTTRTRGMGRYLLLGAGAALLASLAAWMLLHGLLSVVPVAGQVITAVASVGAVAMLLWVNFWLARRLDQRRYLETLSAKAWAALASGSAAGLLLVGFSAFFRQGLEAALLYEVLLGYSKRSEAFIALGAVAALAGMFALTMLWVRAGRQIAPAAFLRLAMPLLMLLSVAFIGGAVAQLQESGYIPVTSAIKLVPRLPYFIATLTGIHPTWETLGAQAVLLCMYGIAFAAFILRRPPAASVPRPVLANQS